MDEKNNGARRRRAFADFKENQYDDSFSLNPSQNNNKTFKRVAKIVLIVLLTAVFIVLGYCFTDSLISVSKQPYNDNKTYTAAHVSPTSPPGTIPDKKNRTVKPKAEVIEPITNEDFSDEDAENTENDGYNAQNQQENAENPDYQNQQENGEDPDYQNGQNYDANNNYQNQAAEIY